MEQAKTTGTVGKKYYTLVDIGTSLKNMINKHYANAYWIKAEIAKLNSYPKSGHCYPDLVEKENGKVKAQLRATIWSGNYEYMNRKFQEVTREPLKEGMTILFRAKVSFHELYGLSLNIIDIEPSFTLGEMAKEKQATIARLQQEGIFDANKKLDFPLLPKRVAVISVETSKGYSDFINIIEGNVWGYRFHHVIFPALLQGDKAVDSLKNELRKIKEVAQNFDVAVIIRGGGGDVGLNCYDHYELAKEVALFPIPVVTGIGHSTNETVVELIAHQNKITPTDVAYFLIQKFHDFSIRLQEIQTALTDLANRKISGETQRLDENGRIFSSCTRHLLEKHHYALNTVSGSLMRNVPAFIKSSEQKIVETSASLKYKPLQVVKEENGKIHNCSKLLNAYALQYIKNESNKIGHLESKVRLLEPENILKRGYSVTYLNGKPAKAVNELKKGDMVTTKVYRGEFKSRIEEINEP